MTSFALPRVRARRRRRPMGDDERRCWKALGVNGLAATFSWLVTLWVGLPWGWCTALFAVSASLTAWAAWLLILSIRYADDGDLKLAMRSIMDAGRLRVASAWMARAGWVAWVVLVGVEVIGS